MIQIGINHRCSGVSYLNVKIKSGRAPKRDEANILVEKLIKWERENKKVYMHCSGGHGRCGTMAALFLGRKDGLDACEAIARVEYLRSLRPDTTRNFIPTPESCQQVAFLVKELGLKDGHVAPDRSDTSWLACVKSQRNKRKTLVEGTSVVTKKSKSSSNKSVSSGETFIHKTDSTQVEEKCQTECEDSSPILFYTGDHLYAELSNYFEEKKASFQHQGRVYKSSEHAFQASKFLHPDASSQSVEYAELIRTASTPNQARILATQKTGGGYAWRVKLNASISRFLSCGVSIRRDWLEVRDDVMYQVLMSKFSQSVHCKAILLATGQRPLVEHTSRDGYWGNGRDGCGENKLGKLLMAVRAALRSS